MQNKIIGEAVKYFKGDKGFARFFDRMKSKFETYDREMAGTVVLSCPTQEERDALSGFMKRDYRRCKAIQIKIAMVQKRLNETRFAGVKVKELVQAYFGFEIITKKTKKQIIELQMAEFFDKILKKVDGTRTFVILKDIIEENGEEFSLFKHEYKANRVNFEKALIDACLGINSLPDKKMLLPVFAAQVTKNPHTFDKKNLAGRLLILLLAKIENIDRPKGVEGIAEFYYKHNLVIDELSNMVLCKNIVGMNGDEEHKGWLGFFENGEAMQVTLSQLSKISGVKVFGDRAIVVENPAVFSVLAGMDMKVPLVCTYGQVKLSGLVLLDFLMEAGVKLYYSGDIDPEGILIADRLKSRYADRMELVGFDVESYFKHLSSVKMSENRLKKLDGVKNEELRAVSEAVRIEGVASYEEEKVEEVIRVLERFPGYLLQ